MPTVFDAACLAPVSAAKSLTDMTAAELKAQKIACDATFNGLRSTPASPPVPLPPGMLTFEEACLFLNVKPSWLYDHTSRSEPIVPHYRYDGLKFSRQDLIEFKENRRVTKISPQN